MSLFIKAKTLEELLILVGHLAYLIKICGTLFIYILQIFDSKNIKEVLLKIAMN